MMTNATGERNLALIQEVLEVFPETARKERRKHMMVSDPEMESVGKCIISNRKSQPGVMTVRGCPNASYVMAHTVRFIADQWGVSEVAACDQLRANTEAVYGTS